MANELTHDSDVTSKIIKFRFAEPFLDIPATVELLRGEHPKINERSLAANLKHGLKRSQLTVHIDPPSDEFSQRDADVCRLWYTWPFLSMRRIVRNLRVQHPGLTPSRVSQIVRDAVLAGHVQVQNNNPKWHTDIMNLEADLCRAFPVLMTVKIGVASPDILQPLSPEDRRAARRDFFFHQAPLVADYIDRRLKDCLKADPDGQTIVALGWGVTLVWLTRYLMATDRPPLKGTIHCVPFTGPMGIPLDAGLDAHTAATRFAEAYKGVTWPLPCPALLSRKEAPVAKKFHDVAQAERMLNHAKLFINSVAPLPGNGVAQGKMSKDPNVHDALVQTAGHVGVCGRIGMVCFRENGSHVPLSHHRVSGLEFDDMRAIARNAMSMTISGGDPERASAIYGALRAHLISHLFTDEWTARRIRDKAKADGLI